MGRGRGGPGAAGAATAGSRDVSVLRIGRLRYLDVPPAGQPRPAGTLSSFTASAESSMWDPQLVLRPAGGA
jgi:hypothetical protein